MDARRVAAIGTIVGGVAAGAAPFLPWFEVTCCGGTRAGASLVATSYGSFMTFLGLVVVVCGLAGLRRWESWRGWAVIAAVASAFVLAAGLRGAIDPIGAAKLSLRSSSSVVAEAGISSTRGYRERVVAAFDRSTLSAESLLGGWVAAVGGAIGCVSAGWVLSRRARRVRVRE